MNGETRLRRCGADEVDHDLIGLQRLTSPVARHVTKQAMLNLVPLTCARRKMAYFDLKPGFIAEFLQFHFPQSISATVAASAISRDQQAPSYRVTATAQTVPPGPNRLDGELGRVAAHPDTHPGFVMRQIIDPVGNRFAFARVRKI